MERLRFVARQDWVHCVHMATEDRRSQTLTFDAGLAFFRSSAGHDNFMVHFGSFDLQEPFFRPAHHRALHPQHDRTCDGPVCDRPCSGHFAGFCPEAGHLRHEYAALISMCDRNLGRGLGAMDAHDLRRDTMPFVRTDRGFLMGGHDWSGKCPMPVHPEVARMPFFVRDALSGAAGERRGALVQPSIDLAPPFDFTKGAPVMKIACPTWRCRDHAFCNLLGNIAAAPDKSPLADPEPSSDLPAR